MKHHWELKHDPGIARVLLRDFIRPALQAVPSSIEQRLGPCRIFLRTEAESGLASRWSESESGLDVEVMATGVEDHDIALELLLCLGQALWEKLTPDELRGYLSLVDDEINAGVTAEIDEQALDAKRELFKSPSHARSMNRLARYGRASFAGTAAEYIHCLWHDVTVRTGAEFLAPAPLRRRLELLARWFPPDPGYRLFPRVVNGS